MEWEIKPRIKNNIDGEKNTVLEKASGYLHKSEDHGKRTGTSSSGRGSTKPPSEGDSNNNMTLTKDFKARILAIKYQNNVQAFLSKFNIHAQGNK